MEFGTSQWPRTPRLSVYKLEYYQNLFKCKRLWTNEAPKHLSTPNTNERKWQQPRLQLHLVTKSRGRRELGLPTWSAAVHPQKNDTVYDVPIYLTAPPPPPLLFFFSSFFLHEMWRDLFIFICSLYSKVYRVWATVRLLHHFGFVSCALILGYAVRIFCATDAKYVMFCVGWQIFLKAVRPLKSLLKNQIFIKSLCVNCQCHTT